ncbi:MAG: tetratricopeptide repeat protein [Gemmatimonadota bacterium]
MFSLKLFGGAIVEGPQGQVRGRLGQKRRIALLATLAVARGRPLSRDKLLALFWPDADEERARHSLADAAYHVRKALGDDALISAGDDLLLNTERVRSDVQSFEDALAGGDLQAAVAQYTGPLLDGFYLDDAPEFERWCDRERDRLSRAYAGALEQLAEAASAGGDARSAVDWWRALNAQDPYNARVVMRFMEALDQSGDRVAAIHQGRAFATLMQADVGVDADAAVLALIEQLKSTRDLTPRAMLPGPVADPPPEPPSQHAVVLSPAQSEAARRRPLPKRRVRALIGAASAIAIAVSMAAALSLRDSAPTDARTIAVLPCANLSGNPGQEFFSDGLTEELITALSQVQSLRVVARTSVFAYKQETRDVREVGKALNVATVLECSVRRVEGLVRVTGQLISTSDGIYLWAQSFDREGSDIIAIQNDLATRIAEALQTRLTVSERGRLTRRPTADQAAYALYLKGQYFWNQRTIASYERAIDYFQQAIALDPQFARAYSGLARTYSLQALSSVFSAAEAGERMRRAAQKAIDLDPGLAEAHAAMGVYLNLYAWDSAAAERAFQRAIALDPNYGDARHYYANMLVSLGRSAEALPHRRRALEADPLSGPLNYGLGRELIRQGETGEGLRVLNGAIELDSANWLAHATIGNYYASIKRFDAAIAAQRRAVAYGGQDAEPGLAAVLARGGHSAEAKAIVARLEAEAQRTGNYPVRVASVYLALNDVAGAMNWLERAYEYKHPQLRLLPLFAPAVSADPRFAGFMQRIGLSSRRGAGS